MENNKANLSIYSDSIQFYFNEDDIEESMRKDSQQYQNDQLNLKNKREEAYQIDCLKRQVADKIKEKKSYPRPHKDNTETEQQYNQTQEKEKIDLEKNQFILKPNYILTERNSCLTDLNSLTNINLNEMMVNQIHFNKCFECETIADPFYVSGMHLLVKDNNGDIENVVLYNYVTKDYHIDPAEIIPIGTKLIIKEPHLQLFGLDDLDFGIRIDSPTDVIIRSYPKIHITKTDDLISQADESFNNSKFYAAIRLYSQAIEIDNKNTKALINRCKTYIKQEKYYLANQDAKQAIKLDSNNEEAHFYNGRSFYLLKKFNLALESFQTCLKINPSNSDAVFQAKKTTDRINESKNGAYDFEGLYNQLFKRECLNMDIAEYMCDKIMITDIENKSKGVVATEFIKQGTLLTVSKAAATSLHNKVDFRKKSFMVVDCVNDSMSTRNEAEIITNLAFNMQNDPDIADQVYALYGGPNYSRDKVEFPFIDIKRIEAIYSFNSFEIKNYIEALELQELDKQIAKYAVYDEDEYSDLDLASIDLKSDFYRNVSNLQIRSNNLDRQNGLFALSAYYNHSCVANCIARTIGDMQIFYTQKDVEKGEELTIRYFSPEWTWSQKVERATEIYGFTCDCQLCKLDESDPMRKIREQLVNQMKMKNSTREVSISEALTDMTKMRYTYIKRPELQILLISPIQILAFKYRQNFNYGQSAKYFEELFEKIKDFNDFGAITLLKEAYADYLNCSYPEKSESCKEKAFHFFNSLSMNKVYYERLWEKMIQYCELVES